MALHFVKWLGCSDVQDRETGHGLNSELYMEERWINTGLQYTEEGDMNGQNAKVNGMLAAFVLAKSTRPYYLPLEEADV